MPNAVRPFPDTSQTIAPARDARATVRVTPRLGGPAADIALCYRLLGDPDLGLRVVLGGISAGARADGPDGWWRGQVGPGRALDPSQGAVLGLQYIDRLPTGWRGVDTHDQAAALAAVLDVLGIGRVDAVVGASYGGCVALAFAASFPRRSGRTLVISAAHRPAPMATALRAIQRRLLALGDARGCSRDGLALARALAMTTYRGDAEFEQRFDQPPQWHGGRWHFPVEGYLDARGQVFARDADADRYRLLSESLDLHRVDPGCLPVGLHALAVRDDRLVPVADMQALVDAAGGELTVIDSAYGHDAFLKETGRIAGWLRDRLDDGERMRRRA